MLAYSHVAFSDDSRHKDGRYNSLGIISLSVDKLNEIKDELNQLFKESDIKSEFKWYKTSGAKYGFAAEKITSFIFKYLDDLRIDVLVWDTKDSRHKIYGRDDNANLGRMYYHLLNFALGSKWSNTCTWCWYPDKQSSLNWGDLGKYLVNKKYETFADLFGINREKFLNLKLKIIKVSSSKNQPFIQVADYFAGLGTYSYGHFKEYISWAEKVDGQQFLFKTKAIERNLSNTEEIRFPLLRLFIDKCKENKLTVSFESTNGLRTHNHGKNINFWLYQPQSMHDKAPVKNCSSM